MFFYLNGTVAHIEDQLVVIDCGGVGYACHTTGNTISGLNMGKAAKLFTHTYIREDAFDIYGFSSPAELNSFRLLLGVSGVGPKAALSILSAATPEDLALSILTGNERMLTAAQGIGKKIAQRIILELRDKLGAPITGGGGKAEAAPSAGGKAVEAQAALAVLGYSVSDIAAAMKGLDISDLEVSEVVRLALKRMLK